MERCLVVQNLKIAESSLFIFSKLFDWLYNMAANFVQIW